MGERVREAEPGQGVVSKGSPGTSLRRCSTPELVPEQGQHLRVGVSLNVTPGASGLLHPVQTPRDSSRQRKVETGKREHRETR